MEKRFITIDGGTTNTRICLLENGSVTGRVKLSIGARDGIGAHDVLKQKISDGIRQLLSTQSVAEKAVTAILASGMITSEFGLYPVAHIPAPAGINELHDGLQSVLLETVSPIPFFFVPGVRFGGIQPEQTDMMRGEETELVGIQKLTGFHGKATYILPGSHSKIIHTDASGRITDFTTMLTGEMIAALSAGTILKSAICLFAEKADPEYLKKGYRCCETDGLNAALFKVRILQTVFSASETALYSFFLGAVLHDEVKAVILGGETQVIIGGKTQMKDALACLIHADSDCKVTVLSEETAESCTATGLLEIYKAR